MASRCRRQTVLASRAASECRQETCGKLPGCELSAQQGSFAAGLQTLRQVLTGWKKQIDKEDKLYTVNQQKLIYLFFTIVTTTVCLKMSTLSRAARSLRPPPAEVYAFQIGLLNFVCIQLFRCTNRNPAAGP